MKQKAISSNSGNFFFRKTQREAKELGMLQSYQCHFNVIYLMISK